MDDLVNRQKQDYLLRNITGHLHRAGRKDELFALVTSPEWFDAKRQWDPTQASYLNDIGVGLGAATGDGITELPWVFALTLLYSQIGNRIQQVSPSVIGMLTTLGEEGRAITHANAVPTGRQRSHAFHAIGVALAALGRQRDACEAVWPWLGEALSFGDWESGGKLAADLCRWGDSAASDHLSTSIPKDDPSDAAVLALCDVSIALSEIGDTMRAATLLAPIVQVIVRRGTNAYGTNSISRVVRSLAIAGASEGITTLAEAFLTGTVNEALALYPAFAYAFAALGRPHELSHLLRTLMPFSWRIRSAPFLGRALVGFLPSERGLNDRKKRPARLGERQALLQRCLESASEGSNFPSPSRKKLLSELRISLSVVEFGMRAQLLKGKAWLARAHWRAGLAQRSSHLAAAVVAAATEAVRTQSLTNDLAESLILVLPILDENHSSALLSNLAALLRDELDDYFWLGLRSQADLVSAVVVAASLAGFRHESQTLLASALDEIEKRIRAIRPRPNDRGQRASRSWEVFSGYELAEGTRSVAALSDALSASREACFIEQADRILAFAEELAVDRLTILELEANLWLKLGDRERALHILGQLVTSAQAYTEDLETAVTRCSALAVLARWLGRTKGERSVAKRLLLDAVKETPTFPMVLDLVHVPEVVVALLELCGPLEAAQFIESAIDPGISFRESGLLPSALPAVARAMAAVQDRTGLDRLLAYFDDADWDELGITAQAFQHVITALGEANHISGLQHARNIGRRMNDSFLSTRSAVIAAVAVEYARKHLAVEAVQILDEAILLIEEVANEDYRITTMATVGCKTAQITELLRDDSGVSERFRGLADVLGSSVANAIGHGVFTTKKSTQIAIGGVAGVSAWKGRADDALNWLEQTEYGIWYDLIIPPIITAFAHHEQSTALAHTFKTIRKAANGGDLSVWFDLLKCLGGSWTEISDEELGHMIPALLTSLDEARYRSSAYVWSHITAFSPFLHRLNLVESTWRCIERANMLLKGD